MRRTGGEMNKEDELNRSWVLGQCLGLERASGILMEDASNCFKNGNDNLANHYRIMALRLKNIAEGERPKDQP